MENKIIYRGTLTLKKLKELTAEHLTVKDNSDIYNPEKNPKAISIIQQEDGNWKGKAIKNGNLIEVRDIDPSLVVLGLITHQ